jgi:hypothetical protein
MKYSKESAQFFAYTEWQHGKSDKDIHLTLFNVWTDAAPGYFTVARWTASFALSVNQEVPKVNCKRGRPISASGDFNSSVVEDLIEENPHLSTREIQELSGIPHVTVWRILTTQRKRQIAPYWVPQNLTSVQKVNRVVSAQCILQRLLDLGESRYSS